MCTMHMLRTENEKKNWEGNAELTRGPAKGVLSLLGHLDYLVQLVRVQVVRGKTEHGEEDAERDVEDNPGENKQTSKRQRVRGASWC